MKFNHQRSFAVLAYENCGKTNTEGKISAAELLIYTYYVTTHKIYDQ